MGGDGPRSLGDEDLTAGEEAMMEPTEKRHSKSASVGRMSWKRLKHLLEDFAAITCVLAQLSQGFSAGQHLKSHR